MNKDGFSLITFLLYVVLASIIISCTYHSISCFLIPSLRAIRVHKQVVATHIMVDLFVREVRMSSIKKRKVTEPTVFIWNNGTEDIGWYFQNNTLERVQGIYTKHNTWKKKTTSIVGSELQQMHFAFHYNGERMTALEIRLACMMCPEKIVHGYVAKR